MAGYDLGVVLSVKGIAEGVENSNYLLATDRGQFILTLYEKRVDPADLPFFLGLMEHLAARGINCPTPGARPRRQGRSGASPTGRRRSSPFSAACGCAGPAPITARRSDGRWPASTSPERAFPSSARTRSRSPAGGRSLQRAADAPTRSRTGSAPRSRSELDYLDRALAARPARRRHPRRSLSRQRLLPRRQTVRPHRLLFRLQRHARLRRGGLHQRLVLRERRGAQRDEVAGAACRTIRRCGRSRATRSRLCRCWHAARRSASFSPAFTTG